MILIKAAKAVVKSTVKVVVKVKDRILKNRKKRL